MSEWKAVPDYPTYEVSDEGDVRRGGRLLKATPHPKYGYRRVNLSAPGRKPRSVYVHVLVAELFIGPRPDGLEVRHGREGKLVNALTNLCYGTSAENKQDLVDQGEHHYAKRTHCKNGHEYTDENTYRTPNDPGTRYCRQCHRDRCKP